MNKRVCLIVVVVAIVILMCALFTSYVSYRSYKKTTDVAIEILKVDYVGGRLIISLSEDGECSLNSLSGWKHSSDRVCIIDALPPVEKIYVRNRYHRVFGKFLTEEISYVESIDATYDKMYLALNGEEKIDYEAKIYGKIEENAIFKSVNPEIAAVDEDGVVRGLAVGKTNIEISLWDKTTEIAIVVSDLIVKRPLEYIDNKNFLSCGRYTKEENDLLDEILAYRVNRVGKKTRAGVVEAARFILLEFPYKISYFGENGRLSNFDRTNYVDGEGRYYHEGLYLHESRFDNIAKSMFGPNTWGCRLYSYPNSGYRLNGLDCSGFISWIIKNGGFDPGDIGAGIVDDVPDMTDLGPKERTNIAVDENKIKAGDLLGAGKYGGHIAMVVAFDKDNYYVAESLAENGDYGTLLKKYSREAVKKFYWHIDMTDYYKDEGEYTEHWAMTS